MCQPVTINQGSGSDEFIKVSATAAYWTNGGGNAVLTCGLPGCAAAANVGGAMFAVPFAIALDSTHFYWTDYRAGGGAYRCKLSGCTGGPSDRFDQGAYADGIFVTATDIFWVYESDGTGNNGTGRVMHANLDGTNVTPLASSQEHPVDVAFSAGEVFWTLSQGNAIAKCTLSACGGTTNTSLVASQPGAEYLAVDATYIYWTNSASGANMSDGSVMRALHDGTHPTTLASGQSYPRGITVDSSYVYWTNYVVWDTTIGTVMRCAIGGCNGQPTTVASAQPAPLGIAQDDTAVYWVNEGNSGSIMRVAK
jgi:hypothetical protein